MNAERIESYFNELKAKLTASAITSRQYQAAVNRLQFQDSQGRYWMIGAQSGNWYVFDGVNWIPSHDRPPSEPDHCPQCSRVLRIEDVVCPECGYRLAIIEEEEKPVATYSDTSGWTQQIRRARKAARIPLWLWSGCAVVGAITLVGALALLGIAPPQLVSFSDSRVVAALEKPERTTPTSATRLSLDKPALGLSPAQSAKALDEPVPSAGGQRRSIIPVLHPATRPESHPQAEPDVPELIAEADRLVLQSRFEEAEAKYSAVISEDPQNATAYAHWAKALVLDLKPEKGEEKALMAIAIDVQHAEGYAWLARALDWQGRYEEALAAAQAATALDPTSAEAQAFLAEVYLDQGRISEAEAGARMALQLDPNSAEAHRIMAFVLVAQGDLPAAIREAEKAAQLEPELWVRLDDLAATLRLIGDCEQAEEFYAWAIDLRPKHVSHAGLGLCRLQTGKLPQAVLSFKTAIILNPRYDLAQGGLALAYARLGQCEQARPFINGALASNPNLSEALEARDLCAGTPSPEPTVVIIVGSPMATLQLETTTVMPTIPTTQPIPPAPIRPSGKMAYPVFDVGRQVYDIYIANADGTERQLLIPEASSPDLSPSGNEIAYRSWASDNRGLFARELSGGNVRQLTAQAFLEDTSPKWSPDGGLITFESRRESDRRARVYLASAGGKNDWVIRRGAEAAFGESPNWAPDGQIIYSTCLGNNCGLALMNNDGGNTRLVTTEPADNAPDISPDGRTIAFMSQRDGNWEIYTVNIDGGQIQRLTSNPANDGLPTWSPDGLTIAFASDRTGHWAIWAMNADGTNQRELFTLEGPLDGRVRQEQDFASRGWVDENISWIP